MEVIDRIGDRWSALWESASSDYLILAILIIIAIPLFLVTFIALIIIAIPLFLLVTFIALIIIAIPLFLLVTFIAFSPGILFEILGEYLKKRFPEKSKSKNVRSWFSLIAVGLLVLWLYFLGSLLDRL